MANLFTATQIIFTTTAVNNSKVNELLSSKYQLPTTETSLESVTRIASNFAKEYTGANVETAHNTENCVYVSGEKRMHEYLVDKFSYCDYVTSVVYGSMKKDGTFRVLK